MLCCFVLPSLSSGIVRVCVRCQGWQEPDVALDLLTLPLLLTATGLCIWIDGL